VSLSLIMNLFPEPEGRAKAMGVYGFVCSAGGSIGVLLGGLLTTLSWHWIFLVNLPIGALVVGLTLALIPGGRGEAHQKLDVLGAIAVTASLMLALSLFAIRNVATANVAGVLWAAAMFAWFFISALYMQLVLGYTPMQVGLSFLPANLIMAAFSLGLSARLVMRFGLRGPLAAGLAMAAAGLALFARAPAGGSFAIDVLPGMMLLGLGAGIAFNPMLLSAMSGVDGKDAGLASGVVNTSFMMGGALGLAVLASLAAARTEALQSAGASAAQALTSGYQLAFAIGAVFALLAAGIGAGLMRVPASHPQQRAASDA
jgi:predicted MFS family arabinose efflux permease